MNNNKNVFSKESKFNGKLKSFIIAFSVFIIILSISSVILFMYSLDFDINNLVEKTTVQGEETTTELPEQIYSVENLSGNSDVMFVLLDNNGKVESVFCTMVDFDNQSFKVRQINGDSVLSHDEKSRIVSNIYDNYACEGLKKSINDNWNTNIEKYVVFNYSDLKKFLSSFNGITVNVSKDIDYKSPEFNLELKKGKQELSGEKALNYLLVCENSNKEYVICDIINSILKPEYVDNADELFKNFVNSSETDISVIDFSQSLDTLKTYCYADDKFSASPYHNGDLK